MRLVVAFAAALLACSPFGADSATSSPPPAIGDRSSDGGGPVKLPDGGTANPGTDAGVEIRQLPADPYGAIGAYDKFDPFSGPEVPGAGPPFAWSQQLNLKGNAPSVSYINAGACDQEGASCSGNVVLSSNDGDGSGYLVTDLKPTTTKFRFDFALKIHAGLAAHPGTVHLATIELLNGNFLTFQLAQNELFLLDQIVTGGGTFDNDAVPAGMIPGFDAWATYRIYVDFEQRTFGVGVNGKPPAGVKTLRESAIKAAPVGPKHARIGITYADLDSFVLSFDDVGLLEIPQ